MRYLTLPFFATLLSATAFAPAFAADLGTYRPGTPYNSAVSAGPDVCDSQCAGDAQCRGWNYVKPNPQAPGICEYLSTVSSPVSSQISISGENAAAMSFSSRVMSGGTNTIRVGTQVADTSNTVKVGQPSTPRRVIRQAVPQRVTSQSASTQPIENMSLTAQQNRYRQGQVAQPQMPVRAPVQQVSRQAMRVQRPIFRPMLDAPSASMTPQQQTAPQQQQMVQPPRQTGRRVTGPRRAVSPSPVQGQIPYQAGPQYQGPNTQNPYAQNPAWQNAATQNSAQNLAQNSAETRGSSRPPVGQPIAQQQQAVRPQPSTPSQRLAQLTAQTQASSQPSSTQGPIALTPQEARTSLFGSLNDDLTVPSSSGMPTATAVPTLPVAQQELGDVLAGGR